MLKAKLKHCDGECQQDKRIWKNHLGKKYCAQCWNKIKPTKALKRTAFTSSQKPIPKQSPRRKKLDVAYSVLRVAHLATHKLCELKCSPDCTRLATDIHHLYWAGNREEFMNDFTEVKVGCRNCHVYVHTQMSHDQAVEQGFKKIK